MSDVTVFDIEHEQHSHEDSAADWEGLCNGQLDKVHGYDQLQSDVPCRAAQIIVALHLLSIIRASHVSNPATSG